MSRAAVPASVSGMEDQLKLCGAALVGNESDILEAFARHTLTFADHLHIMYHNSYDSSQAIVARLIDEGLSISTEVAEDPAFRREQLGCELIRSAISRDRFDYILPLDADEFIVAKGRTVLEAELAAAPKLGSLSLAWISYVPTPDDDHSDPNPITRIRHRVAAPHPSIRKVFFPAELMQSQPDIVLADGNHLLLSRQGRPVAERRSQSVYLAHFPVRSSAQFTSKAILGTVVRQVSPDFTDHQSRHWRTQTRDPDFASGISHAKLEQIARTYLGEDGSAQLLSDPLDTRATQLRYAHLIQVDPFGRLARCIEALAVAGALVPVDASRADGNKVVVKEDEYRTQLAELDGARRTTQHLHQELEKGRRELLRARKALIVLSCLLASALTVLLAS
jgi:Glycosyl transferase family 2